MGSRETSEGTKSAKDRRLHVLVSGASFAGLATAWWMNRLGYAVTVVEVATGLRKGGTPVDIREGVVEVVRRMGLLDKIAACSLEARSMEFVDGTGSQVAFRPAEAANDGHEIERDALLDLLFHEVEHAVEFLFNDSIAGLEEFADDVAVTFKSGKVRSFSFVFGCDGTHSAVRRMCFGAESSYLVFLRNYFSLTIVDKLLIEEDTSMMFNTPGKTIMLNAYHGKTDIGFCFSSEQEIDYDRRNRAGQKRMIREHFEGEGWKTEQLLQEMELCDDFYFDKLSQVRMPTWTRGRVALVGDAGYCPSPAAGMGGSMALLGAAALADAFERYPGDYRKAFQEYDASLRPTVEEIQKQAIEFGLEMFLPSTEEALQRRNAQLNASRAE